MEYNSLPTKVKQSLNGKIAQYMDVYIRQNRVWTPEQMWIAFLNEKNEEYNTQWFETIQDEERKETIRTALFWLLSHKGQMHIFDKMSRKYDRDNDIAERQSPITERVRFGSRPEYLYDIRFGLKGSAGHNRMTTEELRAIEYNAWTVEHVEEELEKKYDKNINAIFNELPFNHYEIDFLEYWMSNFYAKGNPVLIPYINGLRPSFGFLEYKGKAYSDYRDIGIEFYDPSVKYTRLRYDFMLVNVAKMKSCFIDILPDNLPTKELEKSINRIKRILSEQNNFDYLTFSQSEIKKTVKNCFSYLKEYLTP